MKRPVIFILIFSILLTNCKNKDKENIPVSNTIISGTFQNGKGSIVKLKKILPEKFIVLDSIRLNNESGFRFEFKPEKPGFYALENDQGEFITVYCENKDSIYVEGNYYNFDRFRLSGSEEVSEIMKLNEATRDFLDEVGEYARIITDSVGSENYSLLKEEIDKKYREAFNELRDFSLDFLDRNEGSLITLLALTNQLGRDFFVFHPMKDYNIFKKVDSVLFQKYPNSESVKRMHSRLEMIKLERNDNSTPLAVGEKAPPFSLKNPSDEWVSLSQLTGQILLIDFWASWYSPSRENNQDLLKIYKKYHEKGFEILQVSLDRNYEDWVNAIENDTLIWHHGSELNFWDSEITKSFGVSSLPANFLLDQKGKIIAVNLSPAELEKEMKKIFN